MNLTASLQVKIRNKSYDLVQRYQISNRIDLFALFGFISLKSVVNLLFSDWTIVQLKGHHSDHNLEEVPLKILTNTPWGKPEQLKLDFGSSRQVSIEFNHRRCSVHYCGSYRYFSQSSMDRSDNEWTFLKTSEALTIHLNGLEVVNLVFDEHSIYCTRPWSQDITSFSFHGHDSASDYWQAVQASQCDAANFQDYFDNKVTSDTILPVDTITTVDISLSCEDSELPLGDLIITCYGGGNFFYSKTPQCLPSGS